MQLYQQIVMDHYRNPRNRGTVPSPDFTSAVHNPSCGDSLSMAGCIKDGIVTKLAFTGSGCVISQAAASMLVQASEGKSINELNSFDKTTLLSLLGIQLGPTRLKCALLALDALQQGLSSYTNA